MARPLGAPLVDRTIRLRGRVVGDRDRPVTVRQVGLRSVSAIRYWSEDGDFRRDPDAAVAISDLGRVYPVGKTCLLIWPPAAGWPETLENSNLQIDLVQGIELSARTDQLRQAVVLMVRFLYLGPREYRAREAFNVLLDHWRYRGPILPEPEILTVAPDPTPIPHPGTHTRRIGWSSVPHMDAGFDAASVLLAGDSFVTDSLVVPTTTLTTGYLVIAVTNPPGYPTALYIDGNTFNQISVYTPEGTVGDVNLDGEPHEVLVGLDELATANVVGRTISLGY